MQVFTQANPVYKGYIRWNRLHNETKTINKKEDWIVRKGNHPAILSEELFDRAQKRYQSEYHPKNKRASATYQHWLSGIIKCSTCGRTLSYNRVYKNEKNYSYFQCYGYSKKLCSVSHGISEQKIVSILVQSLSEAVYTGRKYQLKEKQKKDKKEIEENTRQLLQIQLKKLKKKEERIQLAYKEGIDTLEEYKRNKQLLFKERKHFEQISFSLLEEQDFTQEEKKAQIFDVITAIQSDCFTNIEKNKALRTIIEKIIYDKEKGDVFVYYKCFGKEEE